MYDLRKFPRLRANLAEQARELNREATIGRWRLAAPMYEVRSTMYDLGKFPRLRANLAEQARGG